MNTKNHPQLEQRNWYPAKPMARGSVIGAAEVTGRDFEKTGWCTGMGEG